MKKLFLLICLAAFSFTACDKAKEEPIQDQETEVAQTQTIDSAKSVEIARENKVVENLEQMKYMNFVKDVKLVGENAIVLFCENYGEFQTLHPDTKISKLEYNDFWRDPDKPKMAFSKIPLSLFKDNKDINTININIENDEMKFYLNISRDEFFQYFTDFKDDVNMTDYFDANRDKSDMLYEEKVQKEEK